MFCFLWQQHPFWDILVIDLNTSFWQLHVLTPCHLSHLPESSQQTFYCNFQFSFKIMLSTLYCIVFSDQKHNFCPTKAHRNANLAWGFKTECVWWWLMLLVESHTWRTWMDYELSLSNRWIMFVFYEELHIPHMPCN